MQKSSRTPSGTLPPSHVNRTSGSSPSASSRGAPNAGEAKTLKRRNRTHKRAEAAIPSMPKELQRPPRRLRNANTSAPTDSFGQSELLERIINAKSLKALDHALASPEGQRLSAMTELKHCPDAALLIDLTGAQTAADLDKVRQELQSRPLSPAGPETARFDAAPLRQRMNKR